MFFLFSLLVATSHYDRIVAAARGETRLPTPDVDGRIETLNNKGAMAPTPDIISQQFMEDLTKFKQSLNVLEIGPAYGNTAMEIVANNNFLGIYTVLDMSKKHIEIIQRRYQKECSHKSMKFVVGKFPEILQEQRGKYDAILMSHVIHFDPENVEASIRTLHQLLKPGGRAYVVTKTPYSNRYASFIPIFTERKARGERFPGLMHNVSTYADPAFTSPQKLKELEGCKLQVFDVEILTRLFQAAGFQINVCKEFSLGYDSEVWKAPPGYKGREDIGIIAQKLPPSHL